VDEPRWQGLDPSQRRQRTLDAVKALLLRESQVQPVLLAFEDLQWMDSETQALLDSLVKACPWPASRCSSTIGPSTRTAGAARPTMPVSGSTPFRPTAPPSCSTRSWAMIPASSH